MHRRAERIEPRHHPRVRVGGDVDVEGSLRGAGQDGGSEGRVATARDGQRREGVGEPCRGGKLQMQEHPKEVTALV